MTPLNRNVVILRNKTLRIFKYILKGNNINYYSNDNKKLTLYFNKLILL